MSKLDVNAPENKAAIARMAADFGLTVDELTASFSDLDTQGYMEVINNQAPSKEVAELACSDLSAAFGLSPVEIISGLSEQCSKKNPYTVSFADFGGLGALDGNAGINVLGGAAPSGTTNLPTVGGDIPKADMGKEDKTEKKEEKKEEPKPEKKEDKTPEAPMAGDIKGKLKAIADNADADKSIQNKAKDILAQIEEAENALDKLNKLSGEFADKNAPKPPEPEAKSPDMPPAAAPAAV